MRRSPSVSLRRIINVPGRGIGQQTTMKLSELAELDKKMDGYAADHPYLRHLQRERARLVGDIQELADGLNFFIGARRQLEENNREALAELEEALIKQGLLDREDLEASE